jgi:hypothetical protein
VPGWPVARGNVLRGFRGIDDEPALPKPLREGSHWEKWFQGSVNPTKRDVESLTILRQSTVWQRYH